MHCEQACQPHQGRRPYGRIFFNALSCQLIVDVCYKCPQTIVSVGNHEQVKDTHRNVSQTYICTHTHTHIYIYNFPLRRPEQNVKFLLYYSYIDFKYTILQCNIGIVMEMPNNDRLLRNCKRLMEKKASYNSHLQFLEKFSNNNIIPNGFRLQWKMNLDSCKEKQLSVKDILDETFGKLIEESIKVCKAELIKTNFEHDSIDTILNREYKNHEEKLCKTKTRKYQNLQRQ